MAHGFVEVTLLAVILLLIALISFTFWDSGRIYRAADSSQYEIYKPTTENDGLAFLELQALNPEVIGWITIYGTNIDYPVTQAEDNLKYINTNAKGRYSFSGAVFLGADCSRDFSDFNSIIHAHHMDKEVMFGEIGYFSEQDYFDARRYGVLYFDGQDHGIEFFAFFHANAYDTKVFKTQILKEEEQHAYLQLLLQNATNSRDISISTDDRIILLSTCSESSTDARSLLVGRLTDEVFDDPFLVPSGGLQIDSLSGLWEQAPLWGKIVAFALLAIVLLWITPIMARKRRSQKRASDMPSRGDEETW